MPEAKSTEDQYPEHAKLDEQPGVLDGAQQFLHWLQSNGYVIAHYVDYSGNSQLEPVHKSENQLVHEFFGVDTWKIEQERRQMIEALSKG